MKRKKYITPTLTVVAFKAEQGFAASGDAEKFLDLSIFGPKEGYNNQAQQNWQEQEESESLFGSWL
ncbi:MAG: hypothetical protein IKN29_00755 [Bacteroidales bacterium]|nr:hypothetical protein [Bacteroidales bacterium]